MPAAAFTLSDTRIVFFFFSFSCECIYDKHTLILIIPEDGMVPKVTITLVRISLIITSILLILLNF